MATLMCVKWRHGRHLEYYDVTNIRIREIWLWVGFLKFCHAAAQLVFRENVSSFDNGETFVCHQQLGHQSRHSDWVTSLTLTQTRIPARCSSSSLGTRNILCIIYEQRQQCQAGVKAIAAAKVTQPASAEEPAHLHNVNMSQFSNRLRFRGPLFPHILNVASWRRHGVP